MYDEDSEAEASDDEQTKNFYKPSFLLIAIDTHPSMFEPDENGITPFKHCLTSCFHIADCLVLTKNKQSYSQFAIVFADEDEKALLFPFANNVIESTKVLKDASKLSNEELNIQYMRTEDIDLAAFFLFCKKQLRDVKSEFSTKTLIYLTNDPDPIKGDANKRFTAINEAKNFVSSDIQFRLLAMNEDFDYSLFYNELFTACSIPPVEEICIDSEGLIEKISSLMIQRISKRKINFFPFKGDHTKYLKCYKLNYIKKANMFNNVYITKNSEVVVKSSAGSVQNNNWHIIVHGNKYYFKHEEKLEVLSSDLPIGYTLFCVSDRITDVGAVLTPSSLLVIDEKEELSYFNQFWQYCVDKKKVLVCIFKFKAASKLRFVELIPKYVNNNKMFMIKDIPYTTEIRHQNLTKFESKYSEEAINVMRELIDKLKFDYDPSFFSNLKYAKKKAYVKAKLLDEEVEDVMDCAADQDTIRERIEDLIPKIREHFQMEPEKKRKAATSRAKVKKEKLEDF